jgi:hypothetical protein
MTMELLLLYREGPCYMELGNWMYVSVPGFYEQGNEHSGEFLDQLLKKNPAPCN